MTIEQANNMLDDISWSYGGESITTDDIVECRKICHEALEKQIPKKIETQTEDDREFIDYICPCCRTTLQQLIKSCYSQRYFKNTVYKYKYCLHCGQALDWSDAE